MKEIFIYDYPNQATDAIKKWIEESLITNNGSLVDGAYRAPIIVEIILKK